MALLDISETNELEVVVALNALRAQAFQHGIEFSGYVERSLNLYLSMPVVTQDMILSAIRFSTTILSSVERIVPPNEAEKLWFKSALDALGVAAPDDFAFLIQSGDVVEVYDMESKTQIYRNLEFLRHSSYDLLTMCLTPYPELFLREEGFDEKIITRSEQVAKFATGTERWGIDDHVLIERMHRHNRSFKLRLGHIAPVTRLKDGVQIGWASTIRVEPLGSIYEGKSNVRPL